MNSDKVIRIWKGQRVVQVVVVSEIGTSTLGGVGGAENSTKIDIEIDPWRGLVVNHTANTSPIDIKHPEELELSGE